MANFVIDLINNYGYIGMFIGMVLEAVIIIIPSEVILATSGIFVSKGIFSFYGAFLTGLIGSVFCAIIIYFMGYYGGEAFVKKYGKYFFMKENELEKSDSWFKKYGLLAALFGRNIPIVRTLISLPIGIMHLSFIKFLIYTIIGSIPWTLLFIYLGYTLGNNWVSINNYIDLLKIPVRILIIYLLYCLIKKIIKNKG